MMKRETFEQVASTFLRRQPFRPFVLELDDGRSLVVAQREALSHYAGSATYFGADGSITFVHPEDVVLRRNAIVYLRPDRGFEAFDAESVCRLSDRPLGPHGAGS